MTKDSRQAESYGIDDMNVFVQDYKGLIKKMEAVPFGVSVNPIKFGPREVKKSDIEDILVRYHHLPLKVSMSVKIDC